MKRFFAAALALAVICAADETWAQSTFQTPAGNVNVQGAPIMCPTMSGNYVPCGSPGALPLPVTIASSGPVAPPGYPVNSIPITGNSTGTTGAVVGTLAARPGTTTYICGF